VDVSFDKGMLTIEARVGPRQQGRSYIWQEYGVGGYHRSFTLETPVDADGIKAQLKNGVLELHVPKAQHARPRKIEIQGG
jgi:HSP20 family protein